MSKLTLNQKLVRMLTPEECYMWLENYNSCGGEDSRGSYVYDSVYNGFTWDESPQGHNFWESRLGCKAQIKILGEYE